jgi:hypothetical protein
MSEQSLPPPKKSKIDLKNIDWKQVAWIVLPLAVFIFATLLAIRGTFTYKINPSNAYWLSAGWILAARAVIATLLWANAVGVRESTDNRARRDLLVRLGEAQAIIADETLGLVRVAQAAMAEAEKSENPEAVSKSYTELSLRLAQAQVAADKTARYSESWSCFGEPQTDSQSVA